MLPLVIILSVLVGAEALTNSNNRRAKLENHRKPLSSVRRNRSRSSQSATMATKHFKPIYTARERSTRRADRPNIILVLTDDQDVELGSLQFMPKLNKYIKEEGALYQNGFVSTPMCCPSRSSLLTGLYVHNHKVHTNNDNCTSNYWIKEHEPKTFAAYLQDSGYSTGYFGKYLNKYNGHHVPVGWGEWHGLLRNSRFYNYSLNVNGEVHHHGFEYEKDYLPDIITNRSLNFIKWSKTMDPDSPVMAVLSYPGPHGPEDAAPQYQHLFFNVTTHHTPAYDFAPNPDKQWILRHMDKMQPIQRHFTDLLMTKRLQTLQTVDDAMERLVNMLDQLNQLDNTFIFYTSDHGYHLGQFGLVKGKAFPFDFDTKVPFLVRGPGVPRNTVRAQPVVNIDLAPTFLDIAGLEKPPHMDGESILSTLVAADTTKPWRSALLLERGKMTFERYEKVSGESANEVLGSEFQNLLTGSQLTRQARLKIECQKPRYKVPCSPHQKWFCKEKPDGGFKIRSCRTSVEARLGLDKPRPQCHCKPGEMFGWKYSSLDKDEKKLQRKFLRQHVPESAKIEQKFLKTLPRIRSLRQSRSTDEINMDGIFEDVAHEELKEVDGLVEDIAEEIRDLHNLNSTVEEDVGCKLDRDNVVCSNDVISDKQAWESSRSTVRQQIQRLRAQLNELKQIRKYLRTRRPPPAQQRQGDTLPLDLRAYSLDDDLRLRADENAEICTCESERFGRKDAEKRLLSAEWMSRREERKVEKIRRKEKKRMKQEKKEKKNRSSRKSDHCKEDAKMNCFSHDNSHWRTPPFWTEGPFCACTNSNNNTYWCVRNVNSTHNYLYCEYVTGMVTYFDMRVDPHQLRNVLHTLTDAEVNYMHSQVIELREYSAEREYIVQAVQKARRDLLIHRRFKETNIRKSRRNHRRPPSRRKQHPSRDKQFIQDETTVLTRPMFTAPLNIATIG